MLLDFMHATYLHKMSSIFFTTTSWTYFNVAVKEMWECIIKTWCRESLNIFERIQVPTYEEQQKFVMLEPWRCKNKLCGINYHFRGGMSYFTLEKLSLKINFTSLHGSLKNNQIYIWNDE